MYCDLVQCYKIVDKLVDLPMEDYFLTDFNYHNLRGHSLTLKPVGSLSVYSCRYNFFLTTSYKSVELITIKCY